MSVVELGAAAVAVPGSQGRVRLPAAALRRLAEVVGERPLLPADPADGEVARRLGDARGPGADPFRALGAAGLVSPSGDPVPGVRELFARWHAAGTTVDLELWLTRPQRRTVAIRHRAGGGTVVALATSGPHAELAWMPVGSWWTELARCAVVSPSGTRARLPARFEVPWEHLVATGAAAAAGREDLVVQVVQEGDREGSADAASGGASAALLSAFHALARGRLHARVSGRSRGAHLEWVLAGDDWHELEVVGQGHLRVQRARPADLAARVAALVEVVR